MSNNIQTKIENRLEEVEEEAFQSLPEFSGYDVLSHKFENLQKELIKWNQELVRCSDLYSEAQSELSYLKELINKKKGGSGRRNSDQIKMLKQFIDRYADVVNVLKSKSYDVKTIIESVRSLQSHMYPELKV